MILDHVVHLEKDLFACFLQLSERLHSVVMVVSFQSFKGDHMAVVPVR